MRATKLSGFPFSTFYFFRSSLRNSPKSTPPILFDNVQTSLNLLPTWINEQIFWTPKGFTPNLSADLHKQIMNTRIKIGEEVLLTLFPLSAFCSIVR